MERIPQVKSALSQCLDDSGVHDPVHRNQIYKALAAKIGRASGGILRLIEYSMAQLTIWM